MSKDSSRPLGPKVSAVPLTAAPGFSVDVSDRATRSAEGEAEVASPKRPRLLVSKPPSAGSPSSGASLYPPGFAGINLIHGDVPMDEFSSHGEWMEEVESAVEDDPTDELRWEVAAKSYSGGTSGIGPQKRSD